MYLLYLNLDMNQEGPLLTPPTPQVPQAKLLSQLHLAEPKYTQWVMNGLPLSKPKPEALANGLYAGYIRLTDPLITTPNTLTPHVPLFYRHTQPSTW